MAEERFNENTTDDQRALNMLLEKVRGLRVVSSPMPLAKVEADDADRDRF